MEETPSNLLLEIREILISEINEFIADSIIRTNLERIGIASKDVNFNKLDDFCEKIKISLLLFLSEKETLEIIKKIKGLKKRNNGK